VIELNQIACHAFLDLLQAALIWLTGHLTPDHKTIADFRKDNGQAIKKVGAQFVQLCRQMGLLAKASVAIDGSKFKAVNNRDKNFTKGKLHGYNVQAAVVFGAPAGPGDRSLCARAGSQHSGTRSLRLRGICASSAGRTILVGNRVMLAEHGVATESPLVTATWSGLSKFGLCRSSERDICQVIRSGQ
jgi:hypothetical protein